MHESPLCFHRIEWPVESSPVAGPVVWFLGWVNGKPGYHFVDVRMRAPNGMHLGLLGLPRTDLAAHFNAPRPWLAAGFAIGVPLAAGQTQLRLDAMDEDGNWHELETLSVEVAADGAVAPRIEGHSEVQAGGSWTLRDPHAPFCGHLEQPRAAAPLPAGRAKVEGWLRHQSQDVAATWATLDGVIFNRIALGLPDGEVLAKNTLPETTGRHFFHGWVDAPATLNHPACLRMYSETGDGQIHLCFARRVGPGVAKPETPPAKSPGGPPLPCPAEHHLPDLPSGRPRRLLMFLRSLQTDDASLRALDLARHLQCDQRWKIRLITTEDGPLRTSFERSDVAAMIVNPGTLFAADSKAAATAALSALEKEIWWRHLDAVAVFDQSCFWASILAGRQGLPVLFDSLAEIMPPPDPATHEAVRALIEECWHSTSAFCFGSAAAADAHKNSAAGKSTEIIPPWHTPDLPDRNEIRTGQRLARAPLRTIDWLIRRHPAIASRWKFLRSPADTVAEERLARLDEAFHFTALLHPTPVETPGLSLILGPLGAGPRIRTYLDAAACGIPIVTTDSIPVAEPAGQADSDNSPDNPMALAHALLAFEGNPAPFTRRAEFLQNHVRTHHAPGTWLRCWQSLLERTASRPT